MRTRRTSEHDAALSRRLAQLGDELSSVRSARPEPPPATDLTTAPWWDEHTRPAAPRRPPAPPPPVPRPVPDAACPGRCRGGTPCDARGVRPGWVPAQLAVVAVVVAVGSRSPAGGWCAGRRTTLPRWPRPRAPALVSASPTVESVGDAPGAGSSGGPPTGAAPGTVTVDVAGKVRHPGIAVLDAGSRVVDALEAAGGARPGVDLTGLNLARVLVDGEQVVVGAPAPSGAAASASPPAGDPSGPVTMVNLNTATESELDTLPEVGPVTAASILQWRDQHGGFTSVDELLEVDGIGEVTLGKLAPYVTV